MKFKFTVREGSFSKINPRTEYHGDEKEAATDIKVKFRGTKRDLDMLCPQQDSTKGSAIFYTEDGHLRMPYLVPMAIRREPEHILVTIYDQNTARKSPPLVFADAKIKNIVVEMKNKFELVISLLLQVKVDVNAQAARLYSIMDSEREFEVVAQQDEMDLFITPDEKKAAAKQDDAFEEDEDLDDDDLPEEGSDPEDDDD